MQSEALVSEEQLTVAMLRRGDFLVAVLRSGCAGCECRGILRFDLNNVKILTLNAAAVCDVQLHSSVLKC